MRLGDAVKALQPGKKKDREAKQLFTVWGEQLAGAPERMPLPDYPRPQMEREQWRCLNGWWRYAFGSAGMPCPEPEGRIRVPFSPETVLSGVRKILQPDEVLWYMLTIEDLEIPPGCRTLLHFGAVDESCCVWWNGRRLGTHRNGYLSFSFDATDAVRSGRNEIRVCVRDRSEYSAACRGKQRLKPGGMFYQAQSGIWQTVWLEFVPEHYITDLKITPDLPRKQVEITVSMNEPEAAVVELEGSCFRFARGAFRLKEGSRRRNVRGTAGADLTLRNGCAGLQRNAGREHGPNDGSRGSFAGHTTGYVLTARIPIENPRLWSPESPELYPFTVSAGEDRVRSYFAMRSFGTGVDEEGHACMTLNGKPYFLHGILDQGYWPESLMTAPSDEAFVSDILEMKKLGFNMIRKHEKAEAARWYYHCDRLGMVVWQDMPHGGEKVNSMLMTYLPTLFPWIWNHLRDSRYRLFGRADRKRRRQFEADLIRMIRQLYNVPSIGLWGLFNEGWGQFDSMRLTEAIRREDPGRPVDPASGWFDQGGGDVKSVHNYFRPLTVTPEKRPFVLSEYGGISCRIPEHVMFEDNYGYQTVSEKEFPEAWQAVMSQIAALRPEGLAADIYTQLSDVEEETNGLLTYDRKICKTDRTAKEK